jgi:hypothetical protein
MANDSAGLNSLWRRMRLTALGICLIAHPGAGRAANNCTWINEATASGLLGGDAKGDFAAAAGNTPAVCNFVEQGAGHTRTLRIAVEIAADPHARLGEIAKACGTGAAPLKAIGNEALVCTADEGKNRMGERAIGRVRDQVFTITISTTLKDDRILTRDALKTRIYTAAEQVSGNLF